MEWAAPGLNSYNRVGCYVLDKAARAADDGVVWLRQLSAAQNAGWAALERINQYRLYELASELHQLPWLTESPHYIEAVSRLRSAKKALLPYCGETPPLRLTIALGAAKELLAALEESEALIFKLKSSGELSEDESDSNAVPSWRFSGVRTALEKFEAVLSAECETRPAFVAPRRGIYDTEELVNAAENAVSATLRPMLSAKAGAELSSGGRCLAFGLFTAAGFHMCRAVEAVLEDYYRRFTGNSGTLKSWHDYIEALRKAVAAGFFPSAGPQTLVYLHQLRESSRNPIMHPRVVLDEADAHEIFDLGKAVISKMAKELLVASKTTRSRKPRMKVLP